MNHRLKICHVITRMIIGGAQENTLLTCQGLLEHGHDVTLVTGPSPGPEGELLSKGAPEGLKVIEVPHLVRQVSPWQDWLAYRALVKLFREGGYDVVHTHASKAGILGRLAARKSGVPYVVHTVHGQPFYKDQNPLLNTLYKAAERFAARYCDKIYAVAQAMVDQCVETHIAPREKYQVVYSGMDLNAFVNATPEADLRAKLGIPDGAPVVGTIARLFPLKGHEMIIAAAPRIVKEFPTVRFCFVGNGILLEELQAKIRAAGLQEHFVFAGLVPPSEVCRYTALFTVLAHLSTREGLPRAAVQALAAAVPVVAYPLDGSPEVVLDGVTGRLCPQETPEAVAECICELLRNQLRCKELGKNGQRAVLQRFDWRKMAFELERDYLSFKSE